MSEVVIKVENLSKKYRIGSGETGYKTFRETLVDAAQAPFIKLRDAGRFLKNSLLPAPGSQPLAPDSKLSAPRSLPFSSDDTFWALKDVSFEVKQGEVIGIIGRNGAGKSTLLKILSKITEPTEGRVELRGRVGSLLEVGTGFHPELTGHENVYLYGAILGMDRWEITRKFDEIIAFAELEKFVDTPVKRYSSGMYMRLAFAVAAHLEPEILLVDEVLAVGDAAFQKKCLGKMGDVSNEGRTVLFVSHNMAAISNLCSRGIVLETGQLVAYDAIDNVVSHYIASLRENIPGDLSLHKDRRGKGRVRFTRLHFQDDKGNPIELGVSGQPLVIFLQYQSKENRPLRNCRISVAFYDNMGQVLFNCSTDLVNRKEVDLPPSGSIRCIIPRLPLSQSQYLLSPFFEVNREIEDWVRGAAVLNVVDGDFYGSGKLYPEGWRGKGVLVPHKWILADH
ncbi:ABC transporter ATP-binding protein [Thermodesulfobacteriota bacterium]